MGNVGEWVARGLVAAFLLSLTLIGVVFSLWVRKIARDPRAQVKARGRLRQRLWKAGVLNGQVSGEEELELLANWQREMGRLQVSARPVLFVGALAGGLAAGALLVAGVSFYWAIWPIWMVALAAILGRLAAGEARRSRGEIVQAHPGVSTVEPALRISNYRPVLALIAGCAAVALSFVVSLLLLVRALPTEPKYGHAGDASKLLRTSEWLLMTPTSALALLLLAELTVHQLLRSPTLSRDLNLQRRAAER